MLVNNLCFTPKTITSLKDQVSPHLITLMLLRLFITILNSKPPECFNLSIIETGVLNNLIFKDSSEVFSLYL